MKIFRSSLLVVLPLALALTLSCGKRCGKLDIGPDGYGRTVMANGITVLVNHDETTSLTAAMILIGGGVLTENSDNNGLTNLMIKMLLKGNDKMTAAEITEKLDYKALEIISQSLLTPTFPGDELEKLKHEVEGSIKASDDNQARASSKLLWKTAYGDQGYGLSTLGTEQSISSITVDQIREHYRKYVGGKNIVFSVATDLPGEEINAIIHNHLAAIKSEADDVPVPTLALQTDKTGFISFDRNQSFIFMGVMLDHLQPKEVGYIILLNEVMGNSVGSRLWFLRQKEKLAYSVYTQYAADKYGAIFRAAIGTDTSKVKIALESLDREWSKLVNDGITENELTDAIVNMKNNMIYRIDRKSNRASSMATFEFNGYGYRFILDLIEMADHATLDEVNAFVKRKFTDDRKFVSIVGKR